MRPLTYLGFTLLSILIQFSIMDFIYSMIQHDEKPTDATNASQKRQLRDVLKDLDYKTHALYYRTQKNKPTKSNAKIYDNTSLPNLFTTTAVFEVLYDESTSGTDEDETSFTTETVYSSTEIDNVTEMSFFEKTNQTNTKPKKRSNNYCTCNFLYEVCDINCCCDVDCSEVEIKMFPNCNRNETSSVHNDDVCYYHLLNFGQDGPITTVLNNLFCIVKINLPKKTAQNKKIHSLSDNKFFTWKGTEKPKMQYKFTNKIYEYGDPIWLINNGSIYYIDFPSPMMNSYCTGRKNVKFLKNHKFSCHAKIVDLEMFQIMKSSEEASVISATPHSMNSTYLNCSSLHCVNWTLIMCKNLICTNYNKSVHEPACTESICTNLALKLEYIFNYQDSKITNATIKFHVQNVSADLQFMAQEIEVIFALANESINSVLKLSGNPGYIENLPVLVSYAESNHTDSFYDKSLQFKTYFTQPTNQGGICVASNLTDNFVLFGSNRRTKCRYYHKYTKFQNSTEQCKSIQNSIKRLFELKNKIFVSPLGDPQKLKDIDWIPMEMNVTDKPFLHGEMHEESSKLNCYNIITRYSFIFSFAEIDGNNRMLSIKLDTAQRNASFSIDNPSAIVTIDVNFVDVTKPSVTEYASSPNLNVYLPRDLFLPFPSNESQIVTINVFYLILYCCIAIIASK